jgi:uncharacterized protein YdaT
MQSAVVGIPAGQRAVTVAPRERISSRSAFEKLRSDNVTLTKDLEEERGKLQTTAAESKTELDKLQAKCDSLESDKVKLEAQLKNKDKEHADSLKEAVNQRVSLLSVAATHKVEKADELSDKDIKIAVIKAVRGDGFDLTDKADAYIEAAFDLCKEDAGQRNDAMAEQRKAANNKKPADKRKDEDNLTSSERRDAMVKNLENAYKGVTK